ncbi:MAG: FGGY-family carbohydrate kinase [Pseudomonadota bacterium]
MTGLALGIDLGTSGVRSAVLDPNGDLVAMARGSYGPGIDDRRDPMRWWAGVTDCLTAQMDALRDEGADPGGITGVAVDGTSGSVVLADASLAPVTRALMYDDAGFDREAGLIAGAAPETHVARGPGSALARTLKLVDEDSAGRAAHLLHQADFIAARLLGKGGWTDLNNALKTGVDPATGAWPEWMARLPMRPTLLPRPVPPGAPLGPVKREVAQQLGLPDNTTVHAGTTDSIAAFLAAAAPVPGTAVTSLGTTLAVKLCSEKRIDDVGLGLYAHRVGDGWLVGGASNTGGGVLRHFFSTVELGRLSAKIDPAVKSHLDFYPLLRPGERFPINDPDLEPRLAPRPADDVVFLHGMLEGIARIERRAYDVLAGHGAPRPDRIVTAGGGAGNRVWAAIRARVLGIPVVEAAFTEAAIGAARLAGGHRLPSLG